MLNNRNKNKKYKRIKKNGKNKLTRGRPKLPALEVSRSPNFHAGSKDILSRRVMPFMSSERYIETQLDGNVVSTWTLIDITPITQGSGDTNRQGRYARIDEMEMLFSLNAQNADIFTNTRIMLIQWKPQSINQLINMANVMQTNNYIYSPVNADGIEAFTILYDSFEAQSGTGSAPTQTGNEAFRVVCRAGFVKNQLYAQASSSSFNKIYFCYISDSALIPFPALKGVSTVTFFT